MSITLNRLRTILVGGRWCVVLVLLFAQPGCCPKPDAHASARANVCCHGDPLADHQGTITAGGRT